MGQQNVIFLHMYVHTRSVDDKFYYSHVTRPLHFLQGVITFKHLANGNTIYEKRSGLVTYN